MKFAKCLPTLFIQNTSTLVATVNIINEWKHALQLMLPRKKWYTWTVLLRLVFLDKEYSSKVFRTLLAMLHFSKVAVAQVFCKKKCSWKFCQPQVFFCKFCEIFKNTFFIKQLRWLLLKAKSRGSRPEVFCKKGVLRNFAKFTGK